MSVINDCYFKVAQKLTFFRLPCFFAPAKLQLNGQHGTRDHWQHSCYGSFGHRWNDGIIDLDNGHLIVSFIIIFDVGVL